MFFYTETPLRDTNLQIDVWKMNGTKAYMRHYEQKMFLLFMAKKGNQTERWQAEKELVICERKLAFWDKHPNTDGEAVLRQVAQMNKDWREPA